MNDMTAVIVPKSDQLSADDLISGPRTITITDVKIAAGTEQPVAMSYEGDDGRPFKPCKSMCRCLVALWGADASLYVGRSMTLYRDPSVKWGGLEVGGIRISHMSDIKDRHTMALTVTKGSKKPFTVQPLVIEAKKRTIGDLINELDGEFSPEQSPTRAEVDIVLASDKCQRAKDFARGDAKARLDAIVKAALDRTAEVSDFPGDRPSVVVENDPNSEAALDGILENGLP